MTKILHSKYSYFILVMKGLMEEFFLPKTYMDNFKMEPNFLFLNRAFWLPLCCISRFQLHLRPRLAQTEEIGEGQ